MKATPAIMAQLGFKLKRDHRIVTSPKRYFYQPIPSYPLDQGVTVKRAHEYVLQLREEKSRGERRAALRAALDLGYEQP